MNWTRIEETVDCHLCSFIKFSIKQCKEFISHWIKKWCSSSTLSLHALKNLSLAGIVGLQYLPVSIARMYALNLSFVKTERTYLLILNVRYFCSSQVARVLLKIFVYQCFQNKNVISGSVATPKASLIKGYRLIYFKIICQPFL